MAKLPILNITWNAVPRIYLDADDVLFITNQTALDKVNEIYGTSLSANDVKSWGFTGEMTDKRLPFFEDPDFIRSLPLYEGSKEFVQELQKIAEVFVCTSVEPQCISARAASLAEHFPSIDASHYVFTSRKDVIEGDILLDDGAHNIINSKVKYPVLFRRPWNENLTGVMAVNNYEDFIHFVKQLSTPPQKINLRKGGCVCLVGPTCTNKEEITNRLCEDERFLRPMTKTTAPAKDNYIHLPEDEFRRLESNFIEKSVYAGFSYGTTAEDIDNIVNNNHIAVLPIDICGGISLRNRYGVDKCLLVYTERNKEQILRELIEEDIPTETKVNLIMSIDREQVNKRLCNLAVDACEVDAIIQKIKSVV